ncbi:hypothetical protein DFH09DRAFT_1076898 [Mycena vulgaris]|nr:hypothetical protein DFH09DRAFT_1076898 [Mycena vulgaris]
MACTPTQTHVRPATADALPLYEQDSMSPSRSHGQARLTLDATPAYIKGAARTEETPLMMNAAWRDQRRARTEERGDAHSLAPPRVQSDVKHGTGGYSPRADTPTHPISSRRRKRRSLRPPISSLHPKAIVDDGRWIVRPPRSTSWGGRKRDKIPLPSQPPPSAGASAYAASSMDYHIPIHILRTPHPHLPSRLPTSIATLHVAACGRERRGGAKRCDARGMGDGRGAMGAVEVEKCAGEKCFNQARRKRRRARFGNTRRGDGRAARVDTRARECGAGDDTRAEEGRGARRPN